jgi:hypothetical protein
VYKGIHERQSQSFKKLLSLFDEILSPRKWHVKLEVLKVHTNNFLCFCYNFTPSTRCGKYHLNQTLQIQAVDWSNRWGFLWYSVVSASKSIYRILHHD